jgi:hypothetical protein
MKIVASSDTNASTWGAGLADAGKALSVEIAASRADLQRLDALLAGAVATLVESFCTIVALSAGREEFAIPLERAATALQFQDLASQLIAHTRLRMDDMTRIGEELDRLDASLAAGKAPAAALAESGARLTACARAMLANNLHQPVRQRELDAGSIELF